jgi:hypothetical protein
MTSTVKVAVRVRPFSSKEIANGEQCIIRMKENSTIICEPSFFQNEENAADADEEARKGWERKFHFDFSYWSHNGQDPHFATQEAVFADLGDFVIGNCFQGYNCSVFACKSCV